MAKAIKFAIVAVCVLCILAICIAPFADLPATNLRSYQMAVMLMWSVVASALSLILLGLKPLFRLWTTLFGAVDPEVWCPDSAMKSFSVQRC
jgi:hypothetical protein